MLELKDELAEMKKDQKDLRIQINALKAENNKLRESNQKVDESEVRDQVKSLIDEERSSTKQEKVKLRQEVDQLTTRTDMLSGSVAFIADQYDLDTAKFSIASKLAKETSDKLLKVRSEIDDLKMQQKSTAMHLDKLEQYGRRENVEIHGVPTMRNENTNQIVKTVAKALNVQLGERHISTSHRLSKPQNQKETRQYPPIIVRFSNRDKRNEIFRKRKNLQANQYIESTFGNANLKITENLTRYKKTLFDTAKLANQDLHYKFLWTSQGQIHLRQKPDSKIITVSSLSDLNKLGYSDPVAGKTGTKC